MIMAIIFASIIISLPIYNVGCQIVDALLENKSEE